jgi:5-methylcytosine-specific restriction protein A
LKFKDKISQEIMELSSSLGVQLSLSDIKNSREFDYEIRISGVDRPHGFSILVGADYLSWVFSLDLDEYATSALEAMRVRFESRKSLLNSFVSLARKRNREFNLKLNGEEIEVWSSTEPWADLELSVRQIFSSEEDAFEAFRTSLLDILCILLSLLVEAEAWEAELTEDIELGDFEGDKTYAVVAKYERSRYNRAICLRYYGFTCRGCGTHMETKYGPIGQDVIHVHHIVPVSQMFGEYRLDPIQDLVPLCPNCHNVVHRTNPPLSISELNLQTGFIPS